MARKPHPKNPVRALKDKPFIRKVDLAPHNPADEKTDLDRPDPALTEPDSLPTRGQEGRDADSDRPLDELCRQLTVPAVRALESIVKNPSSRAGPRIQAACALLDRGWGKPKERVEVTRKSDVSSLSVSELERIVKEGREAEKDERAIPPVIESVLPN